MLQAARVMSLASAYVIQLSIWSSANTQIATSFLDAWLPTSAIRSSRSQSRYIFDVELYCILVFRFSKDLIHIGNVQLSCIMVFRSSKNARGSLFDLPGPLNS